MNINRVGGTSRPERHLIIGAGQVGTALSNSLSALFNPVRLLSRAEFDLREPANLAIILDGEEFDRVWLTAATTKVDWCEEHPDEAYSINAAAPAAIARICADRKIALVHFSTDYVFDGRDGGGIRATPYLESDITNPLSIYGETKLESEIAVAAAHPEASIVRTSAVYSAGGDSFFGVVLGSFRKKGAVEVVEDQIVSLTYAPHLAEWLAAHCRLLPSRVVHLAGGGAASWFVIARAAFGLLGLDATAVVPTTVASLNRPAKRPSFSVLGSEVLPRCSFPFLPSWLEGLSLWAAESRAPA